MAFEDRSQLIKYSVAVHIERKLKSPKFSLGSDEENDHDIQ